MFGLMRPHQWLKSSFVLIGVLFGHHWNNSEMLLSAVLAAVAFSLAASSIYVINDICDIEKDKNHPQKKHRPLACGKVSKSNAYVLHAFLLLVALATAFAVSYKVLFIVASYILLQFWYSFYAKSIVLLDVFCISTGFMLRILAGTTGIGIPPSDWLLLCGMMITLFLGFTKRRAEIKVTSDRRAVLEHYTPALLDKMIGVTVSCMLMSYALFTVSAETISTHGTKNLIFTLPFVLYGSFRYLYLLHFHNEVGEDTAKDIFTDKHMLITGLAWVLSVAIIIA